MTISYYMSCFNRELIFEEVVTLFFSFSYISLVIWLKWICYRISKNSVFSDYLFGIKRKSVIKISYDIDLNTYNILIEGSCVKFLTSKTIILSKGTV